MTSELDELGDWQHKTTGEIGFEPVSVDEFVIRELREASQYTYRSFLRSFFKWLFIPEVISKKEQETELLAGKITEAESVAIDRDRARVKANRARFWIDRGLSKVKVPLDTFDENKASIEFFEMVEEKVTEDGEQPFDREAARGIITQKYLAFVDYLIKRGLSSQTVSMARTILTAYFLSSDLKPAEGPVKKMTLDLKRNVGKQKRDCPTYAQLRAILSNLPESESEVFFFLVKSTGLRPSELLRLRIRDLHLYICNPGWLEVPMDVSKTGNKLKKGRVVCFDDEANVRLKAWMETNQEQRNKTEDELIFAPHTRSHFNTAWFNALKATGLTEKNPGQYQQRFFLQPYSTKYFFETYGIGDKTEGREIPGIPVDVVEYQAGHIGSSTSQIREIYNQPSFQRVYDNNAKAYKDGQVALWCCEKRDEWIDKQRGLGLWIEPVKQEEMQPQSFELLQIQKKLGMQLTPKVETDEEREERLLSGRDWQAEKSKREEERLLGGEEPVESNEEEE